VDFKTPKITLDPPETTIWHAIDTVSVVRFTVLHKLSLARKQPGLAEGQRRRFDFLWKWYKFANVTSMQSMSKLKQL